MNIIVRGSHIEINESIHEYLIKKIKSLEKFLSIDAKIEADLGKTTNHHKQGEIFRAELTITNNGVLSRVVSEKENLYLAMDAVREEALEMLIAKKNKKISLFKKGALKIKTLFLWNK